MKGISLCIFYYSLQTKFYPMYTKTAHTKVIEHLLWYGNRDYGYVVRNLIPLVPRDAVSYDEIMNLLEDADVSLGGCAALQELAIRLYPDRIGIQTLELWFKFGRPRVKRLVGVLLNSHYRSPFAHFWSMIIEAQGEEI